MDVSERESGSLRLTQAGLLIASLGAVMVIVGRFGIVGLVLAGIGTAMAAPGGIRQELVLGRRRRNGSSRSFFCDSSQKSAEVSAGGSR